MRLNDAIFGIVLIAFALAVILHAGTFPTLHGQAYGPALFPMIIAAGLTACGIVLIVKGYASRASEPLVDVGSWAQDRSKVLDVVLLLAGIVFYILFSDWLGFIPSSLIVMTVLLLRLGSGWTVSLVVALATTLVIHTLFAKVLLVPLPWGILQPVAW